MKRKKTRENPLLVSRSIYELISNPDVSDESVYLICEFLTDFLSEFEAQADARIRRHLRILDQEKKAFLRN